MSANVLQFRHSNSFACPQCGQCGNPAEFNGVGWATCSDCDVRWRTGVTPHHLDPLLDMSALKALKPVQI